MSHPDDHETGTDPHPVWRRRDEAPLGRKDRYDLCGLSRFADVYDACGDRNTYGSARGTVLDMTDETPEPRSVIFQDSPEHEALGKLGSRRAVCGIERTADVPGPGRL